MPSTIEASFGLDLGPLRDGFAKAEAMGKAGAEKVQSAIAATTRSAGRKVNWDQVAGVSNSFSAGNPAMANRIRRNSAAGFAPAPVGKYPGPGVEAEAAANSGGGFSAPRGFGRAVTFIAGLREALSFFEKINDTALALREKIQDITKLTGTSSFRGIEEMQANLKESVGAIDEIKKRNIYERQTGSGAFGVNTGIGGILKAGRHLLTGGSEEEDSEQLAAARKNAVKDIADMAEKQTALNAAKAKEMFFDERGADLDREEIRHKEQLGKLAAAEVAADADNPAARNAENTTNRLNREAIERRHAGEKRAIRDQFTASGIRESQRRGDLTPTKGGIEEARARSRSATLFAAEKNIPTDEHRRRLLGAVEARSNLFEKRFDANQIDHGEGGYNFAFHNQERRALRERQAFVARDKDADDRHARGSKADQGSDDGKSDDLGGKLDAILQEIQSWGSDN